MKLKVLIALIAVLVVAGGALKPLKKYQQVEAQSLPITKTLAWDANPSSDGVINYTVTLDGVTVGNPTGTTQAVTFTTLGLHTMTVTATNLFATSAPSSLTVNVVIPTNPKNPKIQ